MQFSGQTVLIGVDDMDLFKGIELKLLALEQVLDHHPEWRGKLVLVQVSKPPRCPLLSSAYLCAVRSVCLHALVGVLKSSSTPPNAWR